MIDDDIVKWGKKAINTIMRIVDSNMLDEKGKGLIRHTVLDEINDLVRRINERINFEKEDKI